MRAQAVAWCHLAVVLVLLALSRAFLPLPRRRPGSVENESLTALFDRCMSPSQRVAHVSDSVGRLLCTQTRDMHVVMNSCGSVHGGGLHVNSFGVHVNSRGAVGHRNSFNSHAAELREETKTMSTSTRCKVGRPAGKERAPLQQCQRSCMSRRGQVANRVPT